MKKLISFAMAIAVVFVGLVCIKPRSFAAESGLLTYTVTDGKACITGTTGTITGDFTVPAEIDGYPVVEIGKGAFANQADRKSVGKQHTPHSRRMPSGILFLWKRCRG